MSEIFRGLGILETCYARMQTTPSTAKSVLELFDLFHTALKKVGGRASSLAKLCREGIYEEMHASLKTNHEQYFAPATKLLEECVKLREHFRRQIEVHNDVREWLEGRVLDLPSYAAWQQTLRSETLSEQEEYVETIMNAIRTLESERPEPRSIFRRPRRRCVRSVSA
jgi:hypothetical protein